MAFRSSIKSRLVYFALAGVLTVLLFLRSLNLGLVWEDRLNLLDNNGWRGFSPAWWFTSFIGGDYKPLVWASYAWDHFIWGLNPLGFHLVNVLLHGLNAALLLALLRRLTNAGRWAALLAALFFSFHPLRVEAVSWVTARKETLFAFFYLASVLTWLNYRRRSGHYRSWYSGSVILAFLSFLSKPMSVSLPAILVLLDFFREDRKTGRLPFTIADKIPYLAGALAVTFAAFYGQIAKGALALVSRLPLQPRIFLAGRSAVFYLEKTLLPFRLFPVYEFSVVIESPWYIILYYFLLIAAITYGCFVAYRKGLKPLSLGWLWFLLTWIPVSGLFQTGLTAWADRFSYLPAVGLSLGLAAVLARPRLQKKVLVPVALAALTLLGILTWRQQGFWADDIALWGKFEPGISSAAHFNLVNALRRADRIKEAIEVCRSGLEVWPLDAGGHHNMGIALAAWGELTSALNHYRISLEIDPHSAMVHSNLAQALWELGVKEEAEKNFRRAVELEPWRAEFYINLANVQAAGGDLAGAEENYRRALRLDHSSGLARYNLGVTLEKRGDKEGALAEYLLAIEADPGLVSAHYNLALILLEKGDKLEARRHFEEAARLKPDYLPALRALGRLKEEEK